MALIVLKCPQCNANIDLDEERQYCFCTYCGTKILNEKKTQIINNYYHSQEDANVLFEKCRALIINNSEFAKEAVKNYEMKFPTDYRAFYLQYLLMKGIVYASPPYYSFQRIFDGMKRYAIDDATYQNRFREVRNYVTPYLQQRDEQAKEATKRSEEAKERKQKMDREFEVGLSISIIMRTVGVILIDIILCIISWKNNTAFFFIIAVIVSIFLFIKIKKWADKERSEYYYEYSN